jgi:hypothetical protein
MDVYSLYKICFYPQKVVSSLYRTKLNCLGKSSLFVLRIILKNIHEY